MLIVTSWENSDLIQLKSAHFNTVTNITGSVEPYNKNIRITIIKHITRDIASHFYKTFPSIDELKMFLSCCY